MSAFRTALTPCGITFITEDTQCFEEYNNTAVILPKAVKDLQEMVEQMIPQQIDNLCASLEVDVMENHPAGENKLSKNYLPGLTKQKIPLNYYENIPPIPPNYYID